MMEKDLSELSDEVIKCQVPRPNSLDKVKHHYWWTGLVNSTASGRPTHAQVADGVDWPMTQDITAIECWS